MFVRSDAEVVAEILDRVILDVPWIDPNPVKIICENGNIILLEQVETKSDSDLIIGLTRRLDVDAGSPDLGVRQHQSRACLIDAGTAIFGDRGI